MSTMVMGLVWPLVLPPSEKAVLVSLADNANDQGVCWPAIEPREGQAKRGTSISERTCLSPRTVQRAISELEQLGLVARTFQRGRSTVYRINLELLQQEKLDLGHRVTPDKATPPPERHPRQGDTPDAASEPPVTLSLLGDTVTPPSVTTSPQPSRTSKNHQGTVIATRAPDLVFEAVLAVCRLDLAELPPNERERVNTARGQLRKVHATPEQIHRLAKIWPTVFSVALTPMGLANNWGQLCAAARSARAQPAPKTQDDWVAWGERNGIPPRPGESTSGYVTRLRDAFEAAA